MAKKASPARSVPSDTWPKTGGCSQGEGAGKTLGSILSGLKASLMGPVWSVSPGNDWKPLRGLLWIYSNSIFLGRLQSPAACGESKGGIFYFYFLSRSSLRTSRNQHPLPQNTSQNNFPWYSLKLKFKRPLETVQVVWSIPRIDFFVLFGS